jgi:carboxyl-terminal processing protease
MEERRGRTHQRGAASWFLPLILGLLLGAFLHSYMFPDPFPPPTIPANAEPDFRLMAEAWNAIEEHYVDRSAVRPIPMTYGAIAGMVDSLGDTGHSVFLSPEMVQTESTLESGEYSGIGVEIQVKDNKIVIVAPLDGSPAEEAGAHAGDIITAVNGTDIEGLSVQEVVRRIKGPAGTRLTITVEDPATGEQRTLSMRRGNIHLTSVTWSMIPGTQIAHLRISLFSQGTVESADKALTRIREQGARGLVLDLRNDPGGILDVAVGVASRFLEGGAVLKEKDAKGNVREIAVQSGVSKYDQPLVVLINGGSASASEIVAGALQDAGRAKLVGDTTFGTGTVLQPVPLSDGSALLLAVMEWLTPKGRTIWHKGITPDVAVGLPAKVTPLTPDAEKGMSPARLRASNDRQLLSAIKLLSRE